MHLALGARAGPTRGRPETGALGAGRRLAAGARGRPLRATTGAPPATSWGAGAEAQVGRCESLVNERQSGVGGPRANQARVCQRQAGPLAGRRAGGGPGGPGGRARFRLSARPAVHLRRDTGANRAAAAGAQQLAAGARVPAASAQSDARASARQTMAPTIGALAGAPAAGCWLAAARHSPGANSIGERCAPVRRLAGAHVAQYLHLRVPKVKLQLAS